MPNPPEPFARDLKAAFDDLKSQALWRVRERRSSATAPRVQVAGEALLTFSSNDYLGLASDPRVIAAFCEAAHRYGVGAGASHLLGGHTEAHHALEEALAAFVGTPRALVFSTGYMANLALLTTFGARHRTLFEDRRNHASLLDAAALSRADRVRYRDPDDLRAHLDRAQPGGLIASDGVFSMDGDIADIPGLLACAQAHDLGLVIDDAHGFGVVGPKGRGSVAYHGLEPASCLIQMGTLGKAFGVFGAFVAGSEALIEALIQKARPYLYTTALPPAIASAAAASLAIAAREDERRAALTARITEFRAGAEALGLRLTRSHSAIQAVLIGGAEAALAASRRLRSRGLLVTAIRPPTVPKGSSRLRIALSAAHTADDVQRLLAALPEAVS